MHAIVGAQTKFLQHEGGYTCMYAAAGAVDTSKCFSISSAFYLLVDKRLSFV